MVIVCQKCRTRFQLDDARIPAKGARVRCSRCKHAFVVVPPGTHDQTVHRLAAEAATTGQPSAPEPTRDLSEPREGGAADAPSEEPEDDWQFNIEPPGGSAASAAPAARAEAPAGRAPAAAPARKTETAELSDDAARSLFELGGLREAEPQVLEGEITDSDPTPFGDGSADLRAPAESAGAPGEGGGAAGGPRRPESAVASWELDPSEAAVPRPAPAAGAPSRPAAARAARRRVQESTAPEPAQVAAAAPPAHAVRPPLAPASFAAIAAGAVGWAVVALLFGAGLVGAARSASTAPALPDARIGSLELRGVRARHLDNYFAGPLLVVAAEIHNPGPEPRFLGGMPRMELTGPDGTAAATAWLGSALHDAALREREPRELAAVLEQSARQLAGRPVRPGETLAVHALFETPPSATGIRAGVAALKPPPSAVAPASQAALAAPDAAPPAADAAPAPPHAAPAAAPDAAAMAPSDAPAGEAGGAAPEGTSPGPGEGGAASGLDAAPGAP